MKIRNVYIEGIIKVKDKDNFDIKKALTSVRLILEVSVEHFPYALDSRTEVFDLLKDKKESGNTPHVVRHTDKLLYLRNIGLVNKKLRETNFQKNYLKPFKK